MAERADALKPDNGYIIDTVAWVRFMMGDYDKAHELLERAVELSGGDPVVMEHLGDVLLKLGKKGEALATYLKARREAAQNRESLDEKIKNLQ